MMRDPAGYTLKSSIVTRPLPGRAGQVESPGYEGAIPALGTPAVASPCPGQPLSFHLPVEYTYTHTHTHTHVLLNISQIDLSEGMHLWPPYCQPGTRDYSFILLWAQPSPPAPELSHRVRRASEEEGVPGTLLLQEGMGSLVQGLGGLGSVSDPVLQ
jgi:hypothetical protein